MSAAPAARKSCICNGAEGAACECAWAIEMMEIELRVTAAKPEAAAEQRVMQLSAN